jgi:hypothetical protein
MGTVRFSRDGPHAVADLARGEVWLADDVDVWIIAHRRPAAR